MAMHSRRTGRKLLVLQVFRCYAWVLLVALLRRRPDRAVKVVGATRIVLVIASL
jgi:hypothetical protein